jgi:hypothetical protein
VDRELVDHLFALLLAEVRVRELLIALDDLDVTRRQIVVVLQVAVERRRTRDRRQNLRRV